VLCAIGSTVVIGVLLGFVLLLLIVRCFHADRDSEKATA
jgi:predicted exporter